ncbi:hypothetical protein StDouc24_02790 [Streptococcus thermophilus]|uniref:hypothetical protein n=1 Tax=Streptococcus thermophilus TaxID=1308 RepID=UPI001C64E293|nr:hypothetical protein [Streptococcus thermophilus]MBW7797510.1 hypothetical protein [Streptococcus thermophilus]
MSLNFPSVSPEDFDFQADWLVKALDKKTMKVLFEGQGKNADLEMTIDYRGNPKSFESLSMGELVQLPRELFEVAPEEPFQPMIEPF